MLNKQCVCSERPLTYHTERHTRTQSSSSGSLSRATVAWSDLGLPPCSIFTLQLR